MIKNDYLILDDEFLLYCKINNINNITNLAKKIFDRGFAIEKYGETPFDVNKNEKVVKKEILIENGDICSEIINENISLKNELQKVNDVLEKINKGTYLKNSDLNNLYSE